jgi:dihydroorotate dehydrogenase (fumarate)
MPEDIVEKKYELGSVIFEHPILNASGCWSSNEEQINNLSNSKLSGVVSKTCTIFSKKGNPECNYYKLENENIHFNSKGLPSLGYSYYREISDKITNKPFILSIAYDLQEKMIPILKDYDSSRSKTSLVEINMSCPNVETKIPGYHIDMIVKLYIFLLNLNLKNIEIGLKLPPYFEIDMMNKIIDFLNDISDSSKEKIPIKYIVLSNSIPNALPLLNSRPVLANLYGGLSGKINKYIALSNVSVFSQKLNKNIKIIGCGGIETKEDIADYLNFGASFVQLGSCFYEETSNSINIEKINKLIGSL